MVAFTRQQRARYIRLHENERKYRLAKKQVRFLEEKTRSIQKRFERARDSSQSVYAEIYWSRLQVSERMLLIYLKYAHSKFDDVMRQVNLLVNNDEDFAQNDGEANL
ncbi:Hypothetical predicted protein [Mytilus galloprovincialis]|uniref:Uncharacterized protein n=1 Tax=Mytilus galloprovincialis TaxID=29158 RepID=A0A8B6E0K1_MYTGA|nr:Hypothetical predicted protein [Mytilus galloprovincialis]